MRVEVTKKGYSGLIITYYRKNERSRADRDICQPRYLMRMRHKEVYRIV